MSPSEIPGWGWALIGIGIFAVVLLFSSWLASPKHYSLRDKVVVITGGSSGIGKAIAAELLKRGANVALVARRQVVLDGELLVQLLPSFLLASSPPSVRSSFHSFALCSRLQRPLLSSSLSAGRTSCAVLGASRRTLRT